MQIWPHENIFVLIIQVKSDMSWVVYVLYVIKINCILIPINIKKPVTKVGYTNLLLRQPMD